MLDFLLIKVKFYVHNLLSFFGCGKIEWEFCFFDNYRSLFFTERGEIFESRDRQMVWKQASGEDPSREGESWITEAWKVRFRPLLGGGTVFLFSHKSKSGLFLLKGEKWQKLYSMYKIFQVFFTGLWVELQAVFFFFLCCSYFLHALKLIHTLFCISTANLLKNLEVIFSSKKLRNFLPCSSTWGFSYHRLFCADLSCIWDL